MGVGALVLAGGALFAGVVVLALIGRALVPDPHRAVSHRECTRCGGSGRARMPLTVHKVWCPACGGRGPQPRQEGAWQR